MATADEVLPEKSGEVALQVLVDERLAQFFATARNLGPVALAKMGEQFTFGDPSKDKGEFSRITPTVGPVAVAAAAVPVAEGGENARLVMAGLVRMKVDGDEVQQVLLLQISRLPGEITLTLFRIA